MGECRSCDSPATKCPFLLQTMGGLVLKVHLELGSRELHFLLQLTCFRIKRCMQLSWSARSLPLSLMECREGWKYGLDDNTIDLIGHALALHLDDAYLPQPVVDFVRIKVSCFPL